MLRSTRMSDRRKNLSPVRNKNHRRHDSNGRDGGDAGGRHRTPDKTSDSSEVSPTNNAFGRTITSVASSTLRHTLHLGEKKHKSKKKSTEQGRGGRSTLATPDTPPPRMGAAQSSRDHREVGHGGSPRRLDPSALSRTFLSKRGRSGDRGSHSTSQTPVTSHRKRNISPRKPADESKTIRTNNIRDLRSDVSGQPEVDKTSLSLGPPSAGTDGLEFAGSSNHSRKESVDDNDSTAERSIASSSSTNTNRSTGSSHSASLENLKKNSKNKFNMGKIYFNTHKYDKAEENFNSSLRARLVLVGPDHPIVAEVHEQLGNLAKEKGEDVKAERHYHAAVKILENALKERDGQNAREHNEKKKHGHGTNKTKVDRLLKSSKERPFDETAEDLEVILRRVQSSLEQSTEGRMSDDEDAALGEENELHLPNLAPRSPRKAHSERACDWAGQPGNPPPPPLSTTLPIRKTSSFSDYHSAKKLVSPVSSPFVPHHAHHQPRRTPSPAMTAPVAVSYAGQQKDGWGEMSDLGESFRSLRHEDDSSSVGSRGSVGSSRGKAGTPTKHGKLVGFDGKLIGFDRGTVHMGDHTLSPVNEQGDGRELEHHFHPSSGQLGIRHLRLLRGPEDARLITDPEDDPSNDNICSALELVHDGDYETALVLFRSALHSRVVTLGTNHIQISLIRERIGNVLMRLDRHHEAERSYNLALRNLRGKVGNVNEDAARILASQGDLYHRMGKPALALTHYNESLSVRREILAIGRGALGMERGIVTSHEARHNAGRVPRRSSFESTTSNFSNIVDDAEAENAVPYVLNDIANILFKQRKFAQAIPYYKKSLEAHLVLEDGKRHKAEMCGKIYFNLGKGYFEAKHYDSAIECLCEAATMFENSDFDRKDLEIASVWSKIGSAYMMKKDYEAAMRVYIKSLKAKHVLLKDEDHPEILLTRQSIGLVLCRQGRFDDAMAIFEDVKSKRQKVGLDRDPDFAKLLIDMGCVYSRMAQGEEELEKADRHCDLAVQMLLEHGVPESHPYLCQVRRVRSINSRSRHRLFGKPSKH